MVEVLVSVTFVMDTVIAVVDDADLSAVERALVRLVTAAVVRVEPEKAVVGSAEREKEPVAFVLSVHDDAPAIDE